ncbi:head-tail adaptor protein [Salinibacillus aidingensis]|uniref:Head-tail adaptor protein n=1 Tax=Salinibacillus aidingensis TaxID=237684 RepID=A0ABN1B6H0_9BACI
MRKFEYKPPRVHSGELRTPVTFYEYVPKEGPYPGEKVKKVLYNAWAKIDEIWLRDVELAKSNGTLSDITIIIRDPQGDYIPTNKHYVEIDAPEYKNKHYNVTQAQPDMQNRDFVNVIAELTS